MKMVDMVDNRRYIQKYITKEFDVFNSNFFEFSEKHRITSNEMKGVNDVIIII